MFFPIATIFLVTILQKSVLNFLIPLRSTLTSLQSPPMMKSVEDGGECKSYMLVGARGTMETQGAGSLGYNPLMETVLSSVPNGGKYEIVYSSLPEYVVTPGEGAASGLQYVKSMISKCPKTLFVLVGYSKGAMVVTQMLADKTLPVNKVAAAVLFGNPYFTAGAPQNKCSAATGVGIAFSIMVKPLPEFQNVIFDCCFEGDMICQTVGTMLAHLMYRDDAGPQAAQYIISKLTTSMAPSVYKRELGQ